MIAKTSIVLLALLVNFSVFDGYQSGVANGSPAPKIEIYIKYPRLTLEERKAQLRAQQAAMRSKQDFGSHTSEIYIKYPRLTLEERKAQLRAQQAAMRSKQDFGSHTSYKNSADTLENVNGNNIYGSETSQRGKTYKISNGTDQTFGSVTDYNGHSRTMKNINGTTIHGSKTTQIGNIYSS